MERQTTIIDLRGSDDSAAGAGFGVLADPTGRRGRTLRRVGRTVAVLFALWLAALGLAGLGLLPGGGIPLASQTATRSEPPPLDTRSPLVPAKDTRPALARPRTHAAAPPARALEPAPAAQPQAGRGRDVASGRKRTVAIAPAVASPAVPAPAVATPVARPPATAPGRTVTSPGHSGTAPGRTRPVKTASPSPAPAASPTPSHGRSETAPGRSR